MYDSIYMDKLQRQQKSVCQNRGEGGAPCKGEALGDLERESTVCVLVGVAVSQLYQVFVKTLNHTISQSVTMTICK